MFLVDSNDKLQETIFFFKTYKIKHVVILTKKMHTNCKIFGKQISGKKSFFSPKSKISKFWRNHTLQSFHFFCPSVVVVLKNFSSLLLSQYPSAFATLTTGTSGIRPSLHSEKTSKYNFWKKIYMDVFAKKPCVKYTNHQSKEPVWEKSIWIHGLPSSCQQQNAMSKRPTYLKNRWRN